MLHILEQTDCVIVGERDVVRGHEIFEGVECLVCQYYRSAIVCWNCG